MRERIHLVRLEPLLARLGDHARVEVDAVSADPSVPQQLQEDPAARSEIEHALPSRVEIDERLGLPANDGLVTAEPRLEVDRVQVRGDFVLAPFLPLALESFEPRSEARRHLPLVVVRGREQAVDALLALEDRPHPPADERDDDLPGVGDEGTDDRFAAARVVLDLLVERFGERSEGSWRASEKMRRPPGSGTRMSASTSGP